MSADLADLIQREIDRALARRPGIKAATITAYDKNTHRIKAMMQPDNIETGWFPIATSMAAGNVGVVMGPTVGDQIALGFLGNDPESPVHLGRMHSDNERPPVAEPGEFVARFANGTQIKVDKTGAISIGTAGQALSIDASGSTMTLKGDVTLTGKFDVTGSSFTHNGKNVGSDHEHINVMAGPANTGPPA